MSEKKNKSKTLAKEIALVVLLWGSILFIVIGGIMWTSDRFDGTIMEFLFPALFCGFISAFSILVFLSNIFKDSPVIWIIAAVLVFGVAVVSFLLDLMTLLGIVTLGPIGLLFLLGLINWIAGR